MRNMSMDLQPATLALSPDKAIAALDASAMAGKLPGFKIVEAGRSFEVEVFSEPFDRRLVGTVRDSGGGCCVAFSLRVPKTMPSIYAVVSIFTVWPGLPLTDSLMRMYDWDVIPTWWWYIPLGVLPLFWVLPRLWKWSALEAAAEAPKIAANIVQTLREAEGATEGATEAKQD